jgi:hypothetical protein
MQELTPGLLWVALFVVIFVASLLTLLGSWLIVWLYRRGVIAAMRKTGFGAAPIADPSARVAEADTASNAAAAHAALSAPQLPTPAEALFERARRAPREAAINALAGGFAFALVLALAYLLSEPPARTPLRFLLTLWVDCWPIVVAIAFTAPSFARAAAAGTAVYFAPFVLGTLIVLAMPPAPQDSIEAVLATMNETVTPTFMLRQWFIYAGLPTAVLLLFLNPRTRAVSPLLLAFATLVASGGMAAWLALFSAPSKDFFIRAADAAGWPAVWLLVGALVGAPVVVGVLGWFALGWIRKAYLAKTISDRSIGIDALWLFFAFYYSNQFVLLGPLWLSTGVLAFLALKLTVALLRRQRASGAAPLAPRGLTFLRVFALGAKSNALFDALAKHWRRIGSMQLITGPDVAHSVVQPHQLLDFVSGRLATHFVSDARAVEARMDLRDRAPDRDAWYRVNSFFCRADTWQAVLARLVGDGDVILMDLRSFTAQNAGCVHELRHLVQFVPLGRCVFIVDASTEVADLRAVLGEAWIGLAEGAPNRSIDPGAVALHRVDSPRAALPQLLRALCAAR